MTHFEIPLLDSKYQELLLQTIPQFKRGIEKESLRINQSGALSQTPHPHMLGSKLTHPYITTDYAEALIELVTPTSHCLPSLLNYLTALQTFVLMNLSDEYLWPNSMPCALPDQKKIAIANYGTSHRGRMKSIYRNGLMHRYGSSMQMIAGIHYNLSFPKPLLDALNESDPYFRLIRNFKRYAWLISYLFGASPAIDHTYADSLSFPNPLLKLNDNTLYLPSSTSLRLSDIGYTSPIQKKLHINYNGLDSYIQSLNKALNTVHPQYNHIHYKTEPYEQLNNHILQISNEYYSNIRPKCVAPEHTPFLQALSQQGTEYVEIRSIDLNPFEPIGINLDTFYFLDILLTFCLLSKSPLLTSDIIYQIERNHATVIYSGRNKNVQLIHLDSNKTISLASYGELLLAQMQPIADLFDQAHQTTQYGNTINTQYNKIKNTELTPASQVLQLLTQHDNSWLNAMTHLAKTHKEALLLKKLNKHQQIEFEKMAHQSRLKQIEIEENQTGTFKDYRHQLLKPL
ncbi:MAG: glutamate--cysteine ligase [Endozoicomonadaceae bacterium]|nr:glutamate--cysteine ligase [Endozoicomonadaceae bacterium]